MGYNNVKDILINKLYDNNNNNQYIPTTIIYNNATAEKRCVRQLRKGKENVSGSYVQFLFAIYFFVTFFLLQIYLPSMKSFFLSLSFSLIHRRYNLLALSTLLPSHSLYTRIYSYTSIED